MKLGLNLGYWGRTGPEPFTAESVRAAEALGFDSLWTAEAYGSDAFTPLAWWARDTTQLRLGTAIAQISARTPTATAMAALTLDHLTGGRATLGIGASGPQVVEGWYGQPYRRPLARTRECVAIIRDVLARRAPVRWDGDHYQLPYDTAGLGKPLKSIVQPVRVDLPILLGAEGPRNVALAAEIADGWIPLFYAPRMDSMYRSWLAEGFGRRTAPSRPDQFEVVCSVPVIVRSSIEDAADLVRPTLALYIGGMGAREQNFHAQVFERMGYAYECATIQEHFLAGRRSDAVAAVTTAMVDDIALIGPRERVSERAELWRSTAITTLCVTGSPPQLEQVAEVLSSPAAAARTPTIVSTRS